MMEKEQQTQDLTDSKLLNEQQRSVLRESIDNRVSVGTLLCNIVRTCKAFTASDGCGLGTILIIWYIHCLPL